MNYKFELNDIVYHSTAIAQKTAFRRPIPMVVIGRGVFEINNGNTEIQYILSTQNDQLEHRTFSRHALLESELIKLDDKKDA